MPLPSLPYFIVIVQVFLGSWLASIYGAVSAEIFTGLKFATIFVLAGLVGNFGAGIDPWLTGYIFDNMEAMRRSFGCVLPYL